jgi:hypothetical protein
MTDPLDGINPPQSNGMAVGALIIGICSMVLAIIPVIGFLSWILSPLAIILGAIALRKAVGKGLAIGGIVTGVIGVLICIGWVLFAATIMNSMPEGTMEEIQREVERASQEANQNAGASQNGGAIQSGGAVENGSDYQASPSNQSSGDYQASPAEGAAGAGAGTEASAGASGGK